MAKPEITDAEALGPAEAPPPASATPKAAAAPEVAAPQTPAAKAKAEKALRLAQSLRANLRRRKVAARPARPSN
ncbi:MAG: hypothetical protein ACT6TH_08125 [Brevundimonas sp.]|uniref:hypothetical protein n=1 Tax=Brevundimonas sp. TaxID=1871086 RepID=UPI0040341080